MKGKEAGETKFSLKQEVQEFFRLGKTERLWHIPVLAAIGVGSPLLTGYFLGRLDFGILSCIGGLVILYLPSGGLEKRITTLMACAFGFVFSYAIGLVFSFNHWLAAPVLGLYAFVVNMATNYFRLAPPGNFFFIMLASMAICMPFDLAHIPTKVGLVAFGTFFALLPAILYSIYITKIKKLEPTVMPDRKAPHVLLTESAVIGLFAGLSLLTGFIFKLHNPYWLPISALAIMQGLNVLHVGRRSFHRISGTFAGMGLAWLLLQLKLPPLGICIAIIVLQFIIEMLITRHYALAVIFITPMTLFLAELGSGMMIDPN
ncbi:MAG: FUSC family protein, partial [Flavitalea sp.]